MFCGFDRQDIGSLRLKVHFSEERILETAAYAPLVDLMIRTVERPLVSVKATHVMLHMGVLISTQPMIQCSTHACIHVRTFIYTRTYTHGYVHTCI